MNNLHVALHNHTTYISTTISFFLIIGTWYINRLLQKSIVHFCHSRNLEQTLIRAIQHVVYIFIYGVGAALLLENLHVQMSSLMGTLGVITIGIGFALQKALANMTSGMFFLFYKPFCIGDYIVSHKPKFEGRIVDINLRLTTLEYQGDMVLIPNSTLYAAIVTIKKQTK